MKQRETQVRPIENIERLDVIMEKVAHKSTEHLICPKAVQTAGKHQYCDEHFCFYREKMGDKAQPFADGYCCRIDDYREIIAGEKK
jgi:hypothetical protein